MAELLLALVQSWPRRSGAKASQEGRSRTRHLLPKHSRRSKLPPCQHPQPQIHPSAPALVRLPNIPCPSNRELGLKGLSSSLVHRVLAAISSLWANHHSDEHDSHWDKGGGTDTIPFSLRSPGPSPHPPPGKHKHRERQNQTSYTRQRKGSKNGWRNFNNYLFRKKKLAKEKRKAWQWRKYIQDFELSVAHRLDNKPHYSKVQRGAEGLRRCCYHHCQAGYLKPRANHLHPADPNSNLGFPAHTSNYGKGISATAPVPPRKFIPCGCWATLL